MPGHISGALRPPPIPRDLRRDPVRDRQIQTQFQMDHQRLFLNDPSKTSLKFWENRQNGNDFEFIELRGIDALQSRLAQDTESNGVDTPVIRHVFLSAGNSQKPLNCTPECYNLLSRHHMVSAEFEDMLLSFGRPAGNFVGFHQPRSYLEIRPSCSPGSPAWEMRNSYKLSAMERARTGNSWVMRQMAVFHSADLASGASFTLTVKANNNEIADRIKSLGGGMVPSSATESFTRSLETQLLGFSWCAEGWTSYISELESNIREISTKISAIPIPSGDEKSLLRNLTMRTTNLEQASQQEKTNRCFPIQRWMESLFKAGSDRADQAADENIQSNSVAEKPNAGADNIVKIEKVAEQQIEALNEFPFDGLQDLLAASTKLREAKLVMELNRRALQDIREHYQAVFDSGEIPQDIKQSCSLAYLSFQQRIKYLEKLLMMECLRADTLTEMAGDGNGLYGSIIQLQGGQISQLLAMDARGASSRMESMTHNMYEIAHNTERDTSSMHVMTFFALVFLPGTFLGVRYYCSSHHTKRESMVASLTNKQSFFSTPIFEGQAPDGSSSWSFNREMFGLFAKICFPMMLVTLILWGLWMLRARHRRLEREKHMARDSFC